MAMNSAFTPSRTNEPVTKLVILPVLVLGHQRKVEERHELRGLR